MNNNFKRALDAAMRCTNQVDSSQEAVDRIRALVASSDLPPSHKDPDLKKIEEAGVIPILRRIVYANHRTTNIKKTRFFKILERL